MSHHVSEQLDEDKALLAALGLLRKQLGDNALLLAAANTKRPEGDLLQAAKELASFVGEMRHDYGPHAAPPGRAAVGRPPAPPSAKEMAEVAAGETKTDYGKRRPPPGPLAGAGAEVATQPKPAQLGGDPGKGGVETKENADARAAKEKKEAAKKGGGGAMGAMAGGPMGAIVGLLGQVASKFAAIIGPAAAMSQVLESNISGFQVMSTATKLLASVLAPVLLPATVLVATALVALSHVLFDEMEGGMKDFFALVMDFGIPAVEQFIDTVKAAAEVLRLIKRGPGEDASAGQKVGYEALANTLVPARRLQGLYDLFAGKGAAVEQVQSLSASHGAGSGSESTRQRVGKSMADVMQSLRLSLGPKASISGLESVGRSAQLAALNNDPIEAQMLRWQQKTFEKMDEVARNTRRGGGGRVYEPGDEAILDPRGSARGRERGG